MVRYITISPKHYLSNALERSLCQTSPPCASWRASSATTCWTSPPVPAGTCPVAFSAVEILTAMYFGGVMRYRPEQPDWPERDRFLLSKGHAAPVFYPVLARAGYVPIETIRNFRQRGSGLHGHPIQGTFPGVENTQRLAGPGPLDRAGPRAGRPVERAALSRQRAAWRRRVRRGPDLGGGDGRGPLEGRQPAGDRRSQQIPADRPHRPRDVAGAFRREVARLRLGSGRVRRTRHRGHPRQGAGRCSR